MMVHNLQIGVSVDEESIKNSIVEAAAKEIYRGLYPDGLSRASGYYSKTMTWSYDLTRIVETEVAKMIAEYKDQIIGEVVSEIAERLSRNKTLRCAARRVVDDANDLEAD